MDTKTAIMSDTNTNNLSDLSFKYSSLLLENLFPIHITTKHYHVQHLFHY